MLKYSYVFVECLTYCKCNKGYILVLVADSNSCYQCSGRERANVETAEFMTLRVSCS